MSWTMYYKHLLLIWKKWTRIDFSNCFQYTWYQPSAHRFQHYCPYMHDDLVWSGCLEGISDLKLLNSYTENGKRLCARDINAAGCSSVYYPTPSVNYPTQGVGYSKVCGKVIGHQQGSTDGVAVYHTSRSINKPHIDEVSITHGSPRLHTFGHLLLEYIEWIQVMLSVHVTAPT